MKKYIYAYAKSLGDIENDVKNHITEIELNFMMLILGPHVWTRHHWKQEIYAQLHDVSITKNDNDFPTKKQLYRWMYTDNIPDFNNPKKLRKLIKAISEKEKELPRPKDPVALKDQAVELMQKYFDWLSSELSESGYVTLKEVESALDTIL